MFVYLRSAMCVATAVPELPKINRQGATTARQARYAPEAPESITLNLVGAMTGRTRGTGAEVYQVLPARRDESPSGRTYDPSDHDVNELVSPSGRTS